MTSNINKSIGIGLAVLTLTAGSAFAASTTGNLTVYSGPSDSSPQVGEIRGQQTFNITSRNGDWCEITSPKAGWVACAQLSDAPRTNFANGPAGDVNTGGAVTLPGYDPHSDPEIANRANP